MNTIIDGGSEFVDLTDDADLFEFSDEQDGEGDFYRWEKLVSGLEHFEVRTVHETHSSNVWDGQLFLGTMQYPDDASLKAALQEYPENATELETYRAFIWSVYNDRRLDLNMFQENTIKSVPVPAADLLRFSKNLKAFFHSEMPMATALLDGIPIEITNRDFNRIDMVVSSPQSVTVGNRTWKKTNFSSMQKTEAMALWILRMDDRIIGTAPLLFFNPVFEPFDAQQFSIRLGAAELDQSFGPNHKYDLMRQEQNGNHRPLVKLVEDDGLKEALSIMYGQEQQFGICITSIYVTSTEIAEANWTDLVKPDLSKLQDFNRTTADIIRDIERMKSVAEERLNAAMDAKVAEFMSRQKQGNGWKKSAAENHLREALTSVLELKSKGIGNAEYDVFKFRDGYFQLGRHGGVKEELLKRLAAIANVSVNDLNPEMNMRPRIAERRLRGEG